MIMSIHF